MHVLIGKHRSGRSLWIQSRDESQSNEIYLQRFLVSPGDVLFAAGLWQGSVTAPHHESRAFLALEFALKSYFGDTTMHEKMGAGTKKKWEDDRMSP